jgi:NCS1 family nucleobase:cation symporter-1
LVACGWFGIQTWFGGFAIYQLINALLGYTEVSMTAEQLAPFGRAGELGDAAAGTAITVLMGALETADLAVLGINPAELGCFLFFWLLQVAIIYRGIESIRVLETLAAPFLIVIGLLLLGWALVKAGGFQPMLDMPSAFGKGGDKEGQFLSVFFPSLTAMVGFWATLSLNIPDFTRYAKSQRDQVLGQAIGLPTTMTLFAFISVAVTAATTVIFATEDPETGLLLLADPIWDPTVLAGKIGGGMTVVVSLFALAVATMSTNIAANVVSPANAIINLNPQRISFQMGGYVTAGLGLVIMPWKLIESTGGYIFTWLIGYSALLGPIAGILIADYFLLRRTELDLAGLYKRNGPYRYMGGFNPAAIVAFVLAVLPNVPGFLEVAGVFGERGKDGVPLVHWFWATTYTYAWFVGFGIAVAVYLGLMAVLPRTDRDSASAS